MVAGAVIAAIAVLPALTWRSRPPEAQERCARSRQPQRGPTFGAVTVSPHRVSANASPPCVPLVTNGRAAQVGRLRCTSGQVLGGRPAHSLTYHPGEHRLVMEAQPIRHVPRCVSEVRVTHHLNHNTLLKMANACSLERDAAASWYDGDPGRANPWSAPAWISTVPRSPSSSTAARGARSSPLTASDRPRRYRCTSGQAATAPPDAAIPPPPWRRTTGGAPRRRGTGQSGTPSCAARVGRRCSEHDTVTLVGSMVDRSRGRARLGCRVVRRTLAGSVGDGKVEQVNR